MKTRATASLLALILWLTLTPAAASQTDKTGPAAAVKDAQDWQGLSSLKPGRRILVELRGGSVETFEGKFIGVAGSKLNLSDDGYTVSLEQSDIHRVYRLKGRWSRSKTARIGAGVGMVLGTIIGVRRGIRAESAVGHVPSDADTAPAFAGFALGTLAGAGLGALLGGRRRGELLYEAK
jgi:hypothetical protein